MTAGLGTVSLERLAACDVQLQNLVTSVVARLPYKSVRDITVLCGHRSKVEQERCFAAGASQLHWPESKHNAYPSLAVDLAPYPVDWTGAGRPGFEELRELVADTARELGIRIRHISWDLPHTELAP